MKYNFVDPKVDSGRRRKKTTKKDLQEWKLKRASGQEGWKKQKKKRVISTKRKKFTKHQVLKILTVAEKTANTITSKYP